jgi:hypothetical protein
MSKSYSGACPPLMCLAPQLQQQRGSRQASLITRHISVVSSPHHPSSTTTYDKEPRHVHSRAAAQKNSLSSHAAMGTHQLASRTGSQTTGIDGPLRCAAQCWAWWAYTFAYACGAVWQHVLGHACMVCVSGAGHDMSTRRGGGQVQAATPIMAAIAPSCRAPCPAPAAAAAAAAADDDDEHNISWWSSRHAQTNWWMRRF